RGQLPGEGEGPRLQFGGRHHLVDDPKLQGALCIHRRAGEAQFQRGGAAGQAQQALGAAEARDQAEVDFRLADLGRVRGDAQVAAHRQFQTAAQCETVHHRDDRLGQGLDEAHHPLAAQGEVAALDRGQRVHLRDVGAGHEGFGTGAGKHHHPDRVVVRGGAEGRVQRIQGRRVQRVQLVRAVDGEHADGAAVLAQYDGFGHGRGWLLQRQVTGAGELGAAARVGVGSSVAVVPCGRYPSALLRLRAHPRTRGSNRMKLRFLAAATLAALTLTAGMASAQDTTSEKGKLSYALGYQLGREAIESGEALDVNTMVKALQDGYAKRDPAVSIEQMRDAYQAMQQRMAVKAKAAFDKAAAENKTRSESFMAQNKAKTGVRTLSDGLQYRVLQNGSGPKPTPA